MPPRHDDPSIAEEAHLLRVLHDGWVTSKGGRERPTSNSFLDSTFENSCFVEGEITRQELRQLLGNKRIARIPARVVRQAGFQIERRPDEAPPGCSAPAAHVVCGPPTEIHRGLYERASRAIANAPEIEIEAAEPVPVNPQATTPK